MNDFASKVQYLHEDLLHMPEGDRYELIDGKLVERYRSFWSSYVAGNLLHRLGRHCDTNRLGWTVPEGTTYQCFPHAPKMVRKADVSFIRAGRWSLAQATEEGHVKIAPDLAVEVLSPNDVVYDLDEKLTDYFTAGVRLVWVVNPKSRTVHVYHPDRTIVQLREQDELTGEDVVPGFRCKVADLFVPPPGIPAS